MRQFGVVATLVVALLVVTAQPASAAVVLLDSFEDGDVVEYDLQRPANVTVQQQRVLAGKWSLNVSATEGVSTIAGAVSTPSNSPSLPTYPEAGDTWTWYGQFDTDASTSHHAYWGAQSDAIAPDGYYLDVGTVDGLDALQLTLRKANTSGDTLLDATTVSYDQLNRANITVRWGAGGDMNVSVRTPTGGTAYLAASDGEFGEGGIGFTAVETGPWQAGADGTATWDAPTQGDLEIREELGTHDLIDNQDINVTLYQDNTIVERETTNGTVPLTGLGPRPFTAQIEASQYEDRRVVFDTAIGNHTAYLVDTSAPTVEPSFTLRDFRGRFPPEESYLKVQRNIDNQWTTVAGDYFGSVNRVSPIIRQDRRYRLVVVNGETGEQAIAGPFAPTANPGLVEIVLRQGSITLEGLPPLVLTDPGTRTLSASSAPGLSVTVEPREQAIGNWTVDVDVVDRDGTRTDLASTTRQTNGGSYSPSIDLTNENGSTVVVAVRWNLTNGAEGSAVRNYTVRQLNINQHALLPTLATIGGRLPSQHVTPFQVFISIAVTAVMTGAVATTLPVSTEFLGGVAVAFLAGFSLLSWIPYSIVFVGFVAWAGFAGLRRGI